MYVGELR